MLRKSLVAARDIPAGTTVSREMVGVKGPGKGLSPQRIDELIGTRLDRDVQADELFTEGDLRTGVDRVLDPSPTAAELGPQDPLSRPRGDPGEETRAGGVPLQRGRRRPPLRSAGNTSPQALFVHAPEFTGSRLLDLCSEDDEWREASIQLIQRTIDKTAELAEHFTGPPGIVIHVGGMSMDEPIADREGLLARAVDSFKALDNRGLTLMPENLPPRPWYLGGQWHQNVFIRAEEMIEFCQELGLGMTLDVSHAQLFCNVYNQSLEDFVRLCLPHVRHLHLADANGIDGEGLQIGEGVVEWEAILELLSREDFTWVPEIWSGHLHHGAGFIEAIHRLSRFGKL